MNIGWDGFMHEFIYEWRDIGMDEYMYIRM